MSGQKYYWLKLKRDFFKRHDIRILEGMKDGHETVLLYLKMLCESVDHDGALRFSDTVPYDAQMLSCVLSTDQSVVERALETFQKLGLIEILDDGTITMTNLETMLGYETDWARQKREYKERKRTDVGQQSEKVGKISDECSEKVGKISDTQRKISDKRIEKEKEKEKELEIEKELENVFLKEKGLEKPALRTRFSKPSIEEVKAYCLERHNNVDAEHFYSYYESNGWRVGKNPMKDWKACVRTWERNGIESRPTAKATKPDIPYMQKEYTQEQIDSMVSDPMADLEQLLGGN